jgi:hypothetical protein
MMFVIDTLIIQKKRYNSLNNRALYLFFMNYVKAPINDFTPCLLERKARRLLENAIAFPSCVHIQGCNSMSCGSTGPRRLPDRPRTTRAWSANQQASFKEPIHLRGLFQCPQNMSRLFCDGQSKRSTRLAWNVSSLFELEYVTR